jgi:hypothetical protein
MNCYSTLHTALQSLLGLSISRAAIRKTGEFDLSRHPNEMEITQLAKEMASHHTFSRSASASSKLGCSVPPDVSYLCHQMGIDLRSGFGRTP